VGIHLTGGQRHECKGFEPLMGHVLLARHPGQPFWPKRMAGDKGYSYPEVRQWLRRHKIKPVIPTREDQPREQDFDKETYRKRNLIERVFCLSRIWKTAPFGLALPERRFPHGHATPSLFRT
jgi:transposase